MAHIDVQDDTISLDEPTLIEGLPGVGLVGKIAADHLVDEFEMNHYANIVCTGLPELAIYRKGERTLRPPVRLYADESLDLLVLQSDIPVSPETASEFATCIVGWLADNNVLPIFLSGLPSNKTDSLPALYGVSTGTATSQLDELGFELPPDNGVIAGPTGALLHHTERHGMPAIGLVVESDPQFPDPEAAHILLQNGVGPLVGIKVDTSNLVDRAEEIRDQKEELAKQMQEGGMDSSRAEPLRMYQ